MSTATNGRAREYRVRDRKPVPSVLRVDEARFFAKVEQQGECWVWTAAMNGHGYGNFTVRKVNIPAHRWAFRYLRGEIGDLQLDHLCRNRACVNPWHLEPVTQAENLRRQVSFNGAKSHCKRGHELSGDNLGIQNGGNRYCKACKRVTDSRRWRSAA